MLKMMGITIQRNNFGPNQFNMKKLFGHPVPHQHFAFIGPD
jgi:hypothetical protein